MEDIIKSVKIKTLNGADHNYKGNELHQAFQEIQFYNFGKGYCMEIEPKAQANGVTQVQAIFQNISNNVKAYVVQKGRFFDPARKFQTVEVCKTKVLTFIFYELF